MKEAAAGAAGEAEVVSNQEPLMKAVEEASIQQRERSRAVHEGDVQISNDMHESDMQADFSEQERRRKGKGVMGVVNAGPKEGVTDTWRSTTVFGPEVAARILRPSTVSGEDSCDPLDKEMGLSAPKPMDSDDAISAAEFVTGTSPREEPIHNMNIIELEGEGARA